MSSYQHTYIGPYLSISKSPLIKKERTIFTCLNNKCVIHDKSTKGNFCKECGTKNDDITTIIDVKTNLYDVMLDFKDENVMFIYDQKYLIPNKKSDFNIYYSAYDDLIVKNIMRDDLAIEQFIKMYSDFLSFLNEKEIEYVINFGVIAYYN